VNPIQAARAAGWFYWLGCWWSSDLDAILHREHPPCWRDGARDLCLAYGIEFAEVAPC
jgi:hypothetical protein